MSILWKIFAALLAVTVLVWLSTMWRWESNQFDPGPSDLLLHLVVLPLVLTGVLVLTVWAVHRLRRYAVSPVASAAAATGGSEAKASGDAALLAPKRLRARVLASAVQVRAGAGWRAAQKAIAKGDCASELDPEIKDEQGVCVFTAPMPDLDTEKVCAEVVDLLQELTVQEPDVWAGFEPATEMLRALTLMGDVLSELDETLNAQWHAWAPPQQTEPLKTSLPERTIADVSRSPELSVRVGIPEGWTALTQRLAMAWIGARLAPWLASAREAAEGVAPRRQMAHADSGRRVPVPTQVQAHVHPVAHAEALWQLGERQLQMWLQQEQAGLLVLVKTIKSSKLGLTSGSASLYELPWYAVIGNPAAGKSTAVVRSGLNFPFSDKSMSVIQGIGGTRNCDWFFTTEGINLQLSLARAEAVRDYLGRQGISPAMITTTGLGPDQPVATNDTPEGRARNRRIEFKIAPG